MADWGIVTEGAKVVKDSVSLWPQIITAVSTLAAAVGGVSLTHRFTLKREQAAAERKIAADRYFIATELVFLLERFAQRCVLSATGSGQPDNDGYIRINNALPVIDYSSVSGDWRSLPSDLMFRLSQLPVLCEEAAQAVDTIFSNDDPFDGREGIFELNHQSCRLGSKAIRLSRLLRRLCQMQNDELSAKPWSTWRVLWHVHGENLQRQLRHARSHAGLHALLKQTLPPPSGDTA